MIVVNCEQGTKEWKEARCGVITASNFAECRKTLKSGKNKGEHTGKAKEYAFRTAVERIGGELLDEDNFDTWAMRRGRELEPEARVMHESQKAIIVEQAGFVKTDDELFGASVDGFFDAHNIAEYKCFVSPSSLMPILLNNDISDCLDQVQGGMWITGAKAAHFVLYCPALKCIGKDLTVFEVERDDNYIEELESDLLKFNSLVNDYIRRLQG